jgi:hypothetical protein
LKNSKNPAKKSTVFTIAEKAAAYLFCFNILPMELMMYLGNDLIESVPVKSDKLSQPGYLGQFKRQLKHRHAELIQQNHQPPEFLVIELTPQPVWNTVHS